MLSREDVLWLVKARRLISPFEANRMGPCSYDLAVGDEYYCYQPDDGDAFRLRRLPADNPDAQCEIPPNGCAFLLTEETINMPSDLVGQVSLRFSLTKKGIMLSPQAPIDPGYCGKIMMMLYNLSDEWQSFHRGDPFVTIAFHQLSGGTIPYQGPNQGISSIRGFMKRDTPIRSSMSRTEADLISSANSLRGELKFERDSLNERFEERMTALEKQVNNRLAFGLSVLGFVLGLAALVAALLPISMQVVQNLTNDGSSARPTATAASTPAPTAEPTR